MSEWGLVGIVCMVTVVFYELSYVLGCLVGKGVVWALEWLTRP